MIKNGKLLGLGLIAATMLAGALPSAYADGGTFTFYKQPGGITSKMCTLSDAKTQRYNLIASKNNPCKNDEASSVVLENVKAGAVLRVYDNQWGHKTDSWSEITVKQPHEHYVVPSFQGNYEDEFIKETYHNADRWQGRHGLNDQISRIEISEPTPNF